MHVWGHSCTVPIIASFPAKGSTLLIKSRNGALCWKYLKRVEETDACTFHKTLNEVKELKECKTAVTSKNTLGEITSYQGCR